MAALTGYMLALLLAAGSIGLYRLDAAAMREDAQALLQLGRLNRWLEGVQPEVLRTPLRAAAARALADSDPALSASMTAAREQLTRHLIVGLPGAPPLPCRAFEEQVFEGKAAAVTRPIEVPFALMALHSPWLDADAAAALAERGAVASLLDRLAAMAAPTTLRVAHALDLPPIETDPCADDAAFRQPRQDDPSLLGAALIGDEVVATFEGAPPPQHVQMQVFDQKLTVSVPARVTETAGPSSLALLRHAGEARLADDLELLWRRPQAVARVRADYGFLPVDYAISTAGAALVQGYAGASLLGLRVTPRRLTLALATVTLIVAAALAAEAWLARRAGRPLRTAAPEGPLAAVISTTPGRALLWAAAPAGAILLAAPPAAPWLAAAAAAGLAGTVAVWQAALADRAAA